jgi:anti-anti-sigma regulatory factor
MLVMHESLSHGLHGATAVLELHDASPDRVARLALSGWLDPIAFGRLKLRFDDLARQGVRRLILDLADLAHVDYRLVPALADLVAGFEARSGAVAVCGLSPYLRDIFRLSGAEPRLRCWASADTLIESPGELAS